MKNSKKIIAIFYLLFLMILVSGCKKNYQIFVEYNFDSGEYQLYGFVTQEALHGETPFAISKKNFVITNKETLNQMKQTWKLKPWRKGSPKCGSTYIMVLMKGSIYVKHFGVNFDCGYLTIENWHQFYPELLTTYQKNIISISEIEVQTIKETLFHQTGLDF